MLISQTVARRHQLGHPTGPLTIGRSPADNIQRTGLGAPGPTLRTVPPGQAGDRVQNRMPLTARCFHQR